MTPAAFAARMVSCALFTNSAVVSSILASSRWKRFVECGDITLSCFLSCCLYRLAQRFYLDACETCAQIISTLHALRRRHRRRIQGQGELLKLHSQYHGCVLDLSQPYFPAVRPTYQYETRAREKPLTPRGADKKPPNSPVL
ncbi:hypothetical protein HPB51_002328 [Rhipicephalus microplus]|uniref:Secreted protein n=1 Tax=Rhipicephalus microplus TaxID=6941 RepID=A0A9J6DSU7_RHIMP|nr:hypothetical protein HPB51_002328 [Rhipicephalus microplus]